MPRGFKLVQSILRGLQSPTVKKIIQWGSEHISPRIGELLIGGSEKLRQLGMGDAAGLAESFTDKALRGMAALPDTVDILSDLGKEVDSGRAARKAARREKKESRRREMYPYNMEPNATFPDPRVAYQAMATLGPRSAAIPGSGMLVYGSDQPFKAAPVRPVKISGRTVKEQAIGIAPHPINTYIDPKGSGKNTFGYLGWPGAANELPAPPYSVAGPYFRKTGPGTNTGAAIPAYGDDHPNPHPATGGAKKPKKKAPPKRKPKMAVAI